MFSRRVEELIYENPVTLTESQPKQITKCIAARKREIECPPGVNSFDKIYSCGNEAGQSNRGPMAPPWYEFLKLEFFFT